MAVAELFIGAFITVLFEKLASGDLIRLARSAGIYSELNKWRNTLIQIQAVLMDAGQKHIRDRSVQLWLNKLQQLAYEIDDVLDDLATEAMRSHFNQEFSATMSNVLKFIPDKLQALKYGHKMTSKINEITTKLRDLVVEKNLLGLNDNVERSHRPSRQLEETSLVDKSKIIGRESDQEALLRKLLDSESSSSQTQNVNVVSVVGLGGIGKTTLAQLLYNNMKLKSHFKLMAWVCVSDEFDVFSISKAIFQAVGGGNPDFANLNLLQEALKEKLSNKLFLLVLDDVWNETYKKWELLQRPFTVGAPGSKVLVTTRKTKVASVMDSIQTYPLELLSDEEALSLFAQHASGKQKFDVNRTLLLHGDDIIRKCGRLPLALKTLGRVFREKSYVDEWKELLNSEIWNLDSGSEILPALQLSYYDLSPHLKQMFSYFCLFPKGYMFDMDELILLWMAEGFLYQPNGNKSMEGFGRECFEELVSRSFLQVSTNDKSKYTMHDLINDLAMSVAGEPFIILDGKMDVYDRNEALEKIHHLSFVIKHKVMDQKSRALQRATRLRTFLAMPLTRVRISNMFKLSNMVLYKRLPQLQFLRVLSIANFAIQEVPHSIGNLKHLRYLNFSNTFITCLPEQVGELHNLQSLLLSNCVELTSLPNSISKLTNLRHLDISHTFRLNKIPLGMGGLTSLQTLSRVIIGGSGKFRISALKDFLHLRGQLSIEGLHKVKLGVHAKEANLQQKKGICDLQMEWNDVFDGSRNELIEYEVLDGLRPFEKLTSLKILYYNGTKFPYWVGDSSFDCLTQLTLRGCRSCTFLPTLGYLPALQKLFVESMYGLKIVGLEFLGPFNSFHCIAFPSLEVLEFKDMKGWEEWSTIGGGGRTFPCLHEISIENCPKLEVVTLDLIPSLQVLYVTGCSLAVLKSMVGVSSSISRLKMHSIRGLTQLDGEVLEHLQQVEYLNISNCDDLTYLWESEAALKEKELHLKISMESVTEVKIKDCPRVESYKCPKNVEKLKIECCPSLTSLTFPATDDLPSSLKFLDIVDCDNVELSWLDNNFLSSLEYLKIDRMHNLRLFPEGCFLNLTKLKIWSCDNLESIPGDVYGFFPFLCLRELQIDSCRNLKSFPHEHMRSLTSLELMTINGCPSLDYSFPCGLWPPKLHFLIIGGLKKPISEWGQQNFPSSLVTLVLGGENSGVVPFAKAGEDTYSSSFLVPSSLTELRLFDFMELKSLSKVLEHLTCLQNLLICRCPKLKDLPETLLPSLSRLELLECSSGLGKKCTSKKGKYWHSISQIPQLSVEQR